MNKAEKLALALSNARQLKQQGRYAEAFLAYEGVIDGLQKPINNSRPKQDKKKPDQ